MNVPPLYRRYLTNFDSTRIGHVFTDVLVVGGGVAGLSAAIEAASSRDVILLHKTNAGGSATAWAQGGIAGVISESDSLASHIADTITAGAGLNRRAAVELVCREGPAALRQLMNWGLDFDRSGGGIALGLEGAHSHPRILHAGGDATGQVLSRFLTARLMGMANARIFEECFLIDLLTHEGACVGAVTYHPRYGHQLIWAQQTIVASGGYGQLYRESTNPPDITGDGVAAGFRAGARAADMEMVQFHPTVLYIAGAARALISEAVRGEGAHLVDRSGFRFMPSYHPDGELAPRDVVSRAIGDHLEKAGTTCAYLDVRTIGAERFKARFPTITARCAEFGIDVATDLIPVRPAAHFTIGGLVTDLQARTTVPNLYACGEASCTGLHGANRLASNSLLEGLVMGRIAGRNAAEACGERPGPIRLRSETPGSVKTMLDLADVRQSLRSLMWHNIGIMRHGDRVSEAVEIVDFWSKFVLDKTFDEPVGWEIQNMLILARLAARSAERRRNSCGVHFRVDEENGAARGSQVHFAFDLHDGRIIETILDLDLQEIR
jgi:L-aspartate oxidase